MMYATLKIIDRKEKQVNRQTNINIYIVSCLKSYGRERDPFFKIRFCLRQRRWPDSPRAFGQFVNTITLLRSVNGILPFQPNLMDMPLHLSIPCHFRSPTLVFFLPLHNRTLFSKHHHYPF